MTNICTYIIIKTTCRKNTVGPHLHLLLQLHLALAQHYLALSLNQVIQQLPLGQGALLDGADQRSRRFLKGAQLRQGPTLRHSTSKHR